VKKKGGAAVATHTGAESAALEVLAAGGSAVEAAITGFFVAAGDSSWTLFAPLTAALAAGGAGISFFDGRARQPGKSVDRPLRWERDKAPAVVRAAAPGSIAALSALAAMASASMTPLVAPGVAAAKAAGANSRAKLLTRIGKATTLAMGERWVGEALREAAPPIEGSLIGPDDLVDIVPDVVRGRVTGELGRYVAVAPWLEGGELPLSSDVRLCILVADSRGSLVTILSEPPRGTLPIFDGELGLPLVADPPRKGLTRTKPGTPLPCPAPVVAVLENDMPVALLATTASKVDESLARSWPELAPAKGTEALTVGRPIGGHAYARRASA
jgi:hypothetical protein